MKRSIGRVPLVAGASLAVLLGYAALDAGGAVPGVLTTRPLPPPPPTATPGTRTLPVVPQPTPSTSVGMPLGSLSGAGSAPSTAGLRRKLEPVLALPALADASLVVRDGQTGTVLLDDGGAVPRVPASTTKLLSAAAIGHVFGPGDVLTTEVVRGTGPGSVILVAGGDSLLAPGKGVRGSVAGHAGLGARAPHVAAARGAPRTGPVTRKVPQAKAPGA
ncbi:MAG: D-alanyl-D-alanine carboxypeptidase, partial [Intrasporangium sp.]|uniref:D-alanyl-D-alanine carboxypeptidase n=1 Tax=Intrasporangium sp. TaxID=1925024 RepID=UPI002647F370